MNPLSKIKYQEEMSDEELINNIQKHYSYLIDDEYKTIKAKIIPLLDCYKKEKVTDSFSESIKKLGNGLKNFIDLLEIVHKLKRVRIKSKLNPKQYSMMLLMNYLVMVEGPYSEVVQLLSYILIENHHDLYNPIGMEFVKNYRNLDKISLFIKLQFVEKHGFKNVSKVFDRKLRNSIAHMGYNIDADGMIEYENIRLTQEEMQKKITLLFNMVIKVFMAYTYHYMFVQKSMKQDTNKL